MFVPQDLHKGLHHPYKHSLCDGSTEVSFHYAIGPKSTLGPKSSGRDPRSARMHSPSLPFPTWQKCSGGGTGLQRGPRVRILYLRLLPSTTHPWWPVKVFLRVLEASKCVTCFSLYYTITSAFNTYSDSVFHLLRSELSKEKPSQKPLS